MRVQFRVMKRTPKQPKTPSFLREYVAINIQELMELKYDAIEKLTNRVKALSTDSGVGYGTLRRTLDASSGLTMDNLERIATALDVLPYQLLIPDLDADNPQVVNGAYPSEKRLYALLRRSRAQTSK